jgi:molybdopterin converting factor small subunit
VITVTVQTVGLLRSLMGHREVRVPLLRGGTVGDLLAALAATYGEQVAGHLADPDPAALHPALRVTVNGRDIGVLDGRQTVLADGDEVLVLTPIAGG